MSDDDDDERPRNARRKVVIFGESFNPKETDNSAIKLHPKTDKEVVKIIKCLRGCFLFNSVSDEDLKKIIDTMVEVIVKKGTIVIKEGDPGDYYYVIEKGIFEVSISSKIVNTYEDVGGFGELALMYNTGRQATVKALSDGKLWSMKRQIFKRLVVQSAHEKRKIYDSFLANLNILKDMSPYNRSIIADALQPCTYFKGENIYVENDTPNGMYFVESGTLVESVETQKNKKSKQLRILEYGNYFGDVEMTTKEKRKSTVSCTEHCQLVFLPMDAFDRIMNDCIQESKRQSTA